MSFSGPGRPVHSFAWVTHPIEFSTPDPIDVAMSNDGRIYEYNPIVVGVSPNFYDVADRSFLAVGAQAGAAAGLSLSEQLYTVRGAQSAIIGSNWRDSMGVSAAQPDRDVSASGFLLSQQARV